jgi:ferric-dicitrate binding protein FerR (iron transport regulator)
MSQNEMIKLLDKYLSGSCSPQEKARIESWMKGLGNQDNDWTRLTSEEKTRYLKKLYDEMHQMIYQDKQQTADGITKVSSRNRRHISNLQIAASFFVLITMSGVLYLLLPTIYRKDKPVSYTTVSTKPGKVKKVILMDSSVVWLNVSSELRYPDRFNGKTREVFLKGEAFFDVSPNVQKPFIIHCEKIKTRVLGTTLDVCAYPDEPRMKVAVVTGKVEVSIANGRQSSHNEGIILGANQLATYDKKALRLTRKNLDHMGDYIGWRNGKLAFHHTTMSEVARVLKRTVGLDMIFQNKRINLCKISGHFDVHQPIEQIVKAICMSIGAHYEIEGPKVRITGPGCKN